MTSIIKYDQESHCNAQQLNANLNLYVELPLQMINGLYEMSEAHRLQPDRRKDPKQ
ncbi:hypothetical protein JNB11_02375 [Kocuria palustris]|nr:hypothetical protein [Kocuria palustris]